MTKNNIIFIRVVFSHISFINFLVYLKIYRIKGELAYDNDDWPSVIEWVELALTEFYKEEERCRVDCEGHFDHQAYPDFIHAVAGLSVINIL